MEDELLGVYKDTTTLTAYSVLYDTLPTTNLSNQIIGELHDPVFGKTVASVYAQFLTSGSTPSFGENPLIDSIVLTLQTAGFYGDTMAALNISVYELDEDLASGTTYYNYNTSAFKDNNLVSQPHLNYLVRPNTTITLNNEVLAPHLRVRLQSEFGQRLIDESGNWLTNEALLEAFKGLYIQAVSTHSTGCLFSCNMTSALTGLVIYYHNNLNEGLSYTFRPSSSGVIYNNFNHFGYTDACQELKRQILDGDTSNIGQLFLQATGGVRTLIRLPNIRHKFASNDNRVVINRAELIISNYYPSEEIFRQPAGLSIQAVLNNGNLYYIPDDNLLSSSGFFGGTYDASSGEYRIRITQYIQQLILNQGNYDNYFYLTVKGSGIHANRLVFFGNQSPTGTNNQQLRVEIAYTTY